MTSRFRVRRALPQDLPRILRIEQAAFGADAWDRATFREYLRHCPQLFLVAETPARLAGYIITCIESGKAELTSLAVAPAFRRRGVGKLLLTQTRSRLERRDIGAWWLMVRTTNESAIGFYRKFGFVLGRLVKNYYEDSAAAWCMWFPF